MNKPEQIVSKVARGEWFTNVGKPDGIVYRSVKTGENTARYEVVARGCSAEVAEQIGALPDMRAALEMFVAWEDNTHETSPYDQATKAMKAARAALAKAGG